MDIERQISDLARRGFLVVTGKGGVGKSAVAATLGRTMSGQRGQAPGTPPEGRILPERRILVIEVDPRENLHQLLGTPPSGGDILDAGGGLFLQHLKPRSVVDRVIEERVRLGAVARKVQSSSVYQHFVDGCPGLKEMAVLEHARRLLDERRFDVVILDAPATGHGVSLLRAPLLVAEAVGEGPFGRIAAEIGELVAHPERCGVVVVTQAEEMPVQEAVELAAVLDQHLRRKPDLLVVNALYPPVPAAAEGDGADRAPASLLDLWRRRRAVNRRELERLVREWPGPMVGLPLLPIPRGPELVSALAGCLRSDPVRALGSVAGEAAGHALEGGRP